MPETTESATPAGAEDRSEARRLLETLAALTSSLDVTRTGDHVLTGLRHLFAFDSASIFLKERHGDAVVYQRSRGEGEDERKRSRPELGRGIVGRVLDSGRAALHATIGSDERSSDLLETTLSAMVAPIIGGEGRLLGALLVESSEPARYSHESLETLMGYARAAAPALERALLYSQMVDERRLEGEMEVARQVMSGLLPSEPPKLAGFDVSAVIEPTFEVGGDYYDFIPLGDDRWAIAMADVSGKGVSSALLVAAMRATLYTLAKRELALRYILRYANEFIHASSGPRAKYVTLFYAVLDIQARRFIYINAGHLPPIVMRAHGEVELLRSGGFPLGFFDRPRYFEQFLQLQSGDLLCLYTDGITEAANSQDEDYGRPRLVEALRRNQQRSAEEICDAVLADVRRFSEQTPADDASVMVLKAL